MVGSRLQAIPEDVHVMTDKELEGTGNITFYDRRLRHAWHIELTNATKRRLKMNMANIWGGVCSKDYFHKIVINNSFKLAYITRPPFDYRVSLEELLSLGIEQLREILLLPHVNEKGKVDARMADVKAKIVQDIVNRVHGQVIQRVEVKSQNMNVNVEATREVESVEDIDAKIRELESQLNQGQVLLDASREVKEVKEVP